MKIRFILLTFLVLNIFPALAQEEAEVPEQEYKYQLVLVLGYTHIPEARTEGETTESENLPTIGLDFFYRIHEKWKLGIVLDLELNKYEVDFEGDRLRRETAFITGIVAGFEILPRWGIIFGPGLEFERNKNLFLLRLGMEYAFELGRSWEILPAINFDFKKEFNTYSLGLGIGKRF
ncbi:MAG: hypothetical protein ACR2MM_03070 [Flavobacteriaceae bacterium]